jgi:GT2 family glycosyltransferase
MKLSIAIPVYDDLQEAISMIHAVQESVSSSLDLEFLLVDLRGDWAGHIREQHFGSEIRCLSAPNLPAAKNQSAIMATAEFLLFLFPGIFPTRGAIEMLLGHLEMDPALTAVSGRWSNAAGKLEIGYNVRRFPTFTALVLDILLLNKLFPRNRSTRRYKMHDFNHNAPLRVEHANDCVFMLRRQAIHDHGGFNERYAPGWFDQAEFCLSLHRAGEGILYEPNAEFVSNENVPLIDRIVRDRYVEYRRAECRYIRDHFGAFAEGIARVSILAGMLQRIGFALVLPPLTRKWFLLKLRSYVDDDYVRSLRHAYWTVLKRSLWREL